jgi:polyisoprenoid-binding protein YceI
MTATAPRTDAPPLPRPGTWVIDTSHSAVEFVARHLMVSKARGRFDDFHGELHVADRPEDSSVTVEIAAASVSTGDPRRDGHLASADFFDVERYPTITFRSTGVRPVGGTRYEVDGELTVHGVTRPVTLDTEYKGSARDPFGSDKVLFSASTEVDREDFGLTWNKSLETGGVLIGKKVRIELEVQADLQR